MRFPLDKRIINLDAAGHVKQGRGIATDYEAYFVDLYAPFDGKIETYYGPEGGNWLRLVRPNGDKIEFAHLSQYLVKSGYVKEGQLIAVTGNTGQLTTGPHLHVQIFVSGNRVDPDKYFNSIKTMTEKEIKQLQALEGFNDPAGVTYWTGKPLSDYLKARLADKVKTINETLV